MVLADHKDKYLVLFSDCVPVRGAKRSAIYDLTRGEIILFGSDYFDFLSKIENMKVDAFMHVIDGSAQAPQILAFLNYLYEEELIHFTDHPESFPKLEIKWESPLKIQNAIVDINQKKHNFSKIIHELTTLGCQFLQLRFFSNLVSLEDIHILLRAAYNKSFEGIEIILKHENTLSDADYKQFVERNPLVSSVVVHSHPEDKTILVDFGYDTAPDMTIQREIRCVTTQIDSNLHCGVITKSLLNVPMVPNYIESRLFNGCLNRKISIDANGNIKNCPTMSESFGNIEATSLLHVHLNPRFQEKWSIHKDLISGCKVCEFRYVCSDCRALTEDPMDPYSKPLKCGYDPLSAEWLDWKQLPEKQYAIRHYHLPESSSSSSGDH